MARTNNVGFPKAAQKLRGVAVRRYGLVPSKAFASPLNDDALYSEEEFEFMMAIDAYKRNNRRPHPTWPEVLAIAVALGYRKCSTAPTTDDATSARTP